MATIDKKSAAKNKLKKTEHVKTKKTEQKNTQLQEQP